MVPPALLDSTTEVHFVWKPSVQQQLAANDASVEELLVAAEAALQRGDAWTARTDNDADELLAPPDGDEILFRNAMAEANWYVHQAQSRLSSDPALFPVMSTVFQQQLAMLRSSLDPNETPEDVLALSDAEFDGSQPGRVRPTTYAMPLHEDNAMVVKFLEAFRKGKRRAYIEASFNRGGRYRAFVLDELAKRGLPEELWVVPVIESGYKTSAYSHARAVGIWQFMAGTARNYGLVVNQWIDERRDPVKSTRAALDYLKDLYEWFNNWDLAIAAYNRGEYGIRRDIKNSGIVDFMEMAKVGATHRETQNHIPKIHAAALIWNHPERYGFEFALEEPVVADTLTIDYVVDIEVAAQCAGVTEKELRALNPELRTWVTPVLSHDYPTYALKLPPGTRDRFQSAVARVDDLTPKRQVVYKVRRGDTLGAIARRFGVPWRRVQQWNNLRSSRIYPGQKLTIFPGDKSKYAAATSSSSSKTAAKSSGGKRQGRAVSKSDGQGAYYQYSVRRGDTLTHIARDFGVSVNDLQKWNSIRSKIVVGQKLKIRTTRAGGGQATFYVVQRGDTLTYIAKKHDTTVSQLRQWNRLGRYLYPGQKIEIRSN